MAGDAAILRYLAAREFPAERCAADEPVSVLDGRSLPGLLLLEGFSRYRPEPG